MLAKFRFLLFRAWVAVVLVGCGGSSSTSSSPATDAGTDSGTTPLVDAAGCSSGFCREALPVDGVVLKAVWGSSANDVWAVGLDGVIVHSDGTRWTASTSPTKEMLNGVWGTGPSDVWAVGGGTAAGVILHFDGKAWTTATSPAADAFTGVYASKPNDAWAVSQRGEVAHYDGAAWTVTTPADGVSWGIHGTSATNVWIPGSAGRTWHGGTGGFSMIPTTVTGESITAIATLSETEAFAVGFHKLFLRYTGGAWTVVRAPSAGGAFVWAVSATAGNDVWMVGNGGYIQRYNGTTFEFFDIERMGTRTFDGHFHGVWATPRDVFLVGEGAIFHLRR